MGPGRCNVIQRGERLGQFLCGNRLGRYRCFTARLERIWRRFPADFLGLCFSIAEHSEQWSVVVEIRRALRFWEEIHALRGPELSVNPGSRAVIVFTSLAISFAFTPRFVSSSSSSSSLFFLLLSSILALPGREICPSDG